MCKIPNTSTNVDQMNGLPCLPRLNQIENTWILLCFSLDNRENIWMNTNKHNSLITANSLSTVLYDQLSVPKLWLAQGNNSSDTFKETVMLACTYRQVFKTSINNKCQKNFNSKKWKKPKNKEDEWFTTTPYPFCLNLHTQFFLVKDTQKCWGTCWIQR